MANSVDQRSPTLRTVEQLRGRIDGGRTGDKIPHPDPALAPLGADAEAGGAPPTKAELRLEAEALGTTPVTTRWPDDIRGIVIYAAAASTFCAAVLGIVLLAR